MSEDRAEINYKISCCAIDYNDSQFAVATARASGKQTYYMNAINFRDNATSRMLELFQKYKPRLIPYRYNSSDVRYDGLYLLPIKESYFGRG